MVAESADADAIDAADAGSLKRGALGAKGKPPPTVATAAVV